MVEAEVLGVLLLRAQQITEAQLRQSLELMRTQGCRQGDAFIEMGVMSYPQLIMVLGKQVEYLFTQLIAMPEGTFTFHDLPALPEPFLPPALRIPNLLFRRSSAKAKELRSEELAAHFKPNINAYVGLHPEARRLLHDVKLSEVERKLVGIIDETNLRLREIFMRTAGGWPSGLRAVFAWLRRRALLTQPHTRAAPPVTPIPDREAEDCLEFEADKARAERSAHADDARRQREALVSENQRRVAELDALLERARADPQISVIALG
jgi:hypothetical protein